MYLVYVMPLIMTPATAALWLGILRIFVGKTQLSTGTCPTFTGTYGPLLGWGLLVNVSVFTIVGWAWATVAAMRWLCSQIRTPGSALDFSGKGH